MLLRPLDVEFPKIPIAGRSSGGTAYTRWVPCGMPHLGQYAPILKAVFFLYPDRASAENGVKSGGTGFLLGAEMKRIPGYTHIHAITNWHVAVCPKDGPPSPVIRINRKSGKPDIFEFDCTEWIFEGGGPDVAISPPITITDEHDVQVLDVGSWIMTPEQEIKDTVGPGDDVFMLGRFVDYDGIGTNQPAARFGHISMMDVRIEQSTNYKGRSIVLDMHSRSGFSGSPVFVYRTIGSHFFEPQPGKFLMGGGHYMKLLGIHYAQFPESWELKAKKTTSAVTQAVLQADSHYVEGLSGMTCVIPAVDIMRIYNRPELAAMREKSEQHNESLGLGVSNAPKPESSSPKVEKAASPPASDENPTHREDFSGLLRKAADPKNTD